MTASFHPVRNLDQLFVALESRGSASLMDSLDDNSALFNSILKYCFLLSGDILAVTIFRASSGGLMMNSIARHTPWKTKVFLRLQVLKAETQLQVMSQLGYDEALLLQVKHEK